MPVQRVINMNIEHIGFLSHEPIQMGQWYKDNLGFRIIIVDGSDSDGVVFLEDDNGTVLEIGNLPGISPVDFRLHHPLSFHLAIECLSPENEAKRLVEAGAELVGESLKNAHKGEKILVRDPWGLTIQLLNRKIKLKKSA